MFRILNYGCLKLIGQCILNALQAFMAIKHLNKKKHSHFIMNSMCHRGHSKMHVLYHCRTSYLMPRMPLMKGSSDLCNNLPRSSLVRGMLSRRLTGQNVQVFCRHHLRHELLEACVHRSKSVFEPPYSAFHQHKCGKDADTSAIQLL